jgi:branched-chain amino acid transport system substrate-binding protein
MLCSWVARCVRLSVPLAAFAIALGAQVSAASADDVIKIGAPLPMTGPLAPEAVKQQQGYDLWADQANKAGGISVNGKKYKVEIVYTDYQSNTPRAVQATEQLITQNNVNYLFAAFGSGAAKAASTVSEKYKVPTLAATASSAQVMIRAINTCSAPSRRTTRSPLRSRRSSKTSCRT